MTPGKIEYFENCKQKAKKGEVLITSTSEIDTQDGYKSLFSKMEHRFKISNGHEYKIEMCAESLTEKQVDD